MEENAFDRLARGMCEDKYIRSFEYSFMDLEDGELDVLLNFHGLPKETVIMDGEAYIIKDNSYVKIPGFCFFTFWRDLNNLVERRKNKTKSNEDKNILRSL